jgi:hypothetical protein
MYEVDPKSLPKKAGPPMLWFAFVAGGFHSSAGFLSFPVDFSER